MPKNIDDVILPERRKSIRNIPIPEGRRKNDQTASFDGVKKTTIRRVAPKVEEPVKEVPQEMQVKRMMPPPRPRKSSRRVWIAALGALAMLTLAILSIFNHATLAYVPKSAALAFTNETYTAAKSGEGKLIYSVVKLSGDKGKSIPVSGEQEVSRKASGTIIVYNDATTEPQRLVENTRFESAGGKVYRIAQAIVIPGKKTTGGTSQPGMIEVTVFADQAGDSYNSAPTDFTIPGLKGTPRYSAMYARSKGPIAGGFIGKEKVASEADTLKARSELRSSLSDELTARAQAEVPADFILFPSLSSVSFEDLPQTASTEAGSATVNLRGHLYGIMFKRTDLAHALAKGKVSVADEEPVDLNSIENLTLSFTGAPPTDLLPANELTFKVEGSTVLVWKTDEVALMSDLLGRKKSDLSSVLKNYPTVSSADATLRPFWSGTFPKEADKVEIKKLNVE